MERELRLTHAYGPTSLVNILPRPWCRHERLVHDPDVWMRSSDLGEPVPASFVDWSVGEGVQMLGGPPVGDCEEGGAAWQEHRNVRVILFQLDFLTRLYE